MRRIDKDDRARVFFITRTYEYDFNGKYAGISESDWRKMIEREYRAVSCSYIFIIFHDKDMKKGVPVGLHAHAVVRFPEAKSVATAMRIFGASSVQGAEPVKSEALSLRYLLHISESAINDEKNMYPKSDLIKVDNLGDVHYSKLIKVNNRGKEKKAKVEEIQAFVDSVAEKVANGDLILSEACALIEKEHGYSALRKHRSSLDEDHAAWLKGQMLKYRKSGKRRLDNVYICGGGGTGKSQIANAVAERLADSRGVHRSAVGGKNKTPDFVSSYDGERVSLANEVRGQDYNMRQFCDVFDRYNYSEVNSRFKDKAWFARYCLFTNSMSVESFIENMLLDDDMRYTEISRNGKDIKLKKNDEVEDAKLQIRRRFSYVINCQLDDDKKGVVTISKLSKDNLNFELVDSIDYKMVLEDDNYKIESSELLAIAKKLQSIIEN